jgi:hypothetical protein
LQNNAFTQRGTFSLNGFKHTSNLQVSPFKKSATNIFEPKAEE